MHRKQVVMNIAVIKTFDGAGHHAAVWETADMWTWQNVVISICKVEWVDDATGSPGDKRAEYTGIMAVSSPHGARPTVVKITACNDAAPMSVGDVMSGAVQNIGGGREGSGILAHWHAPTLIDVWPGDEV